MKEGRCEGINSMSKLHLSEGQQTVQVEKITVFFSLRVTICRDLDVRMQTDSRTSNKNSKVYEMKQKN